MGPCGPLTHSCTPASPRESVECPPRMGTGCVPGPVVRVFPPVRWPLPGPQPSSVCSQIPWVTAAAPSNSDTFVLTSTQSGWSHSHPRWFSFKFIFSPQMLLSINQRSVSGKPSWRGGWVPPVGRWAPQSKGREETGHEKTLPH